MSMFKKMQAALGNADALEALFSNDFVMTSIRSGKTYDRSKALEWYETAKTEVFECVLETDTMLVVQARDRNEDGIWAYMDAFGHNGDQITSCKVVLAAAEELS